MNGLFNDIVTVIDRTETTRVQIRAVAGKIESPRFHRVGAGPHYSLDPSHVGVSVPSMKPHTLMHEPELPFGYPGRNFDDTTSGYSDFDDRCEPPPVDLTEENIVHYGPGYRPLCGEEDELALHTDDLHQVIGCNDCLELVTEDLNDNYSYGGHCLHCKELITTVGGVAWRRAGRRPCPHCAKAGW